MREELELKLQEEFEFMWQNNVDEEKRLYRRWGCGPLSRFSTN